MASASADYGTKTVTVVDATTPTLAIAAGTANAIAKGVLRWTNSVISRWSQVPQAVDGTRTTLNAWFAGQIGASGGIDGVIDLVPAVSDPDDPALWATNGTAGYPTADGVHPSSVMHGAMAAVYRTAVTT